MSLRVGFVTAAHVHTGGLLYNLRQNPNAEVVGIWDHDSERMQMCALEHGLRIFATLADLLQAVDAVVVVSENKLHAEHCAAAAAAGKHILCEKPLVTNEREAKQIAEAVNASGVKLMVAFPCRYSPVFRRLHERFKSGEIGALKAICATNRGRNPGGWFIVPSLSGGGAVMDHSVHVADLLWVLLGQEPTSVQATLGYVFDDMAVEDTAVLTLEYADGLFATIDASWSRPKKYKTWGDVTITLVGETGVLEMDLFAQDMEVTNMGDPCHYVAGYGSDMGQELMDDFVNCILDDRPSPVPLEDGLRASRVVIEAYKNAVPQTRDHTLSLLSK